MSIDPKIQRLMNLRLRFVKQFGLHEDAVSFEWEAIIARYVLAFAMQDLTYETLTVRKEEL